MQHGKRLIEKERIGKKGNDKTEPVEQRKGGEGRV